MSSTASYVRLPQANEITVPATNLELSLNGQDLRLALDKLKIATQKLLTDK